MIKRRAFLQGAAVLAAPLTFPIESTIAQPSPSQRISLEKFIQDPAKIESLARGVSVMKSRAPSNPKSWFFQGAIHGVTEDLIQQALQADPEVANVDRATFWNQCPHFNQASANFIVWHRAYLYYFERILREASGDDSLRLPYWDYQSATGRRFPILYAVQFLDQAGTIPNPLYHFQRELAFVGGLYNLSDAAVETADAMGSPTFFGVTESDGFAGAVQDELSDTQGLIEVRPHGLIHVAVGGSIGNVNGDMSFVPTAAFDPVFWAHHANIDRLWTLWSTTEGHSWGTGPGIDWFNDTPWSFHDVDGQVKKESRGHWVDHRAVEIIYDTIPSDAVPLTLDTVEAAPSASHELTLRTVSVADGGLLDSQTKIAKALGTTLLLSSASDAPNMTVIEIGNIIVERTPSVGYWVFLATDNARVKLGTLNLFAHGRSEGHAHGEQGMAQRFVVPRAARAELGGGPVHAEFEPFDLFESTVGAPAPERKGRVQYGRITVLEG